MGWQILPVRTSPDHAVVDDYLLWSSYSDAPVFRGTRAQCEQFWEDREALLAREVARRSFDRLFESADRYGTSAPMLGDGWGDSITCREVAGGPGLLPRERLCEFADLMFPGYPDGPDPVRAGDLDRAAIGALLEPFENDDEDDESGGDDEG